MKCWCCEREKEFSKFRHVAEPRAKEVLMNRNKGIVIVTIKDIARRDGLGLCDLCKKHILNEAADAIVF